MKTIPTLIATALLIGFIVREEAVPAPAAASRPRSQIPAEAAPENPWSSRLQEATQDSSAAARLLDNLRHFLSTHRRPESIALVKSLLLLEPAGETGQQWQWDEIEGRPVSIPRLRSTLLAWLSELSPADATPFTAAIFQAADASAEDWAVALHALLRDNAGGQHTSRLREQSYRLLQREDFLAAPTPGLLDALALTAVCGGQAEFINLTELCGLGLGEGVDDAAEAAALRVLQGHPIEALRALAEDRELLARAPLVRGRLAAAGSPSDPEQEALVTQYWNRPDLGTEEREAFAAARGVAAASR